MDEDDEKKNDPNKIFYNILHPSNKVHCDFCDKEITRHAKIYCAECKKSKDTEMDICLNCFANGCENKNHLPTHNYHIINKLTFPLFTEEWTTEEELLLIEGIEKCGFGNWADIAEHICTDKTKEDCEKHYEEYYLSSKNYIPKQKIISKRDKKNSINYINKKKNLDEIYNKNKKNKMKTEKKEALVASSNRTTLTTANIKKDSGTNASEIVGYMPLRGDFDIEYDNDAELLLAEMEFNDEDNDTEIDLKLKILEIYNLRLDERIKRKQFVIERDLLDFNKQANLDKMRTKEEKEVYNLMKVFARFSTADEHEQLVHGIIQEKDLKSRIEELNYYKKIGLKTFEDVEVYKKIKFIKKHLLEKRKKDEDYQKRQKQLEGFLYENNSKKDEKKTNVYCPAFQEPEANLCEKLNINPYDYLLIKDLLIRESVKEGFVKKEYAQNLVKIGKKLKISILDKERVSGIFDFLVAQNKIFEKKN